MSVLLTICARGGSKGLRNKALLKINKKKLIDYTINIAQKIDFVKNIVVSTDSEKIIEHCKSRGINIWFKRSKFLSNDKVGKLPVIIDAVKKSESYYKKGFETIIDLDVTSPLRKIQDVKKAYSKFKLNNCDNLFSVMRSRHNPYFNMVEKVDKTFNLVKNNKKISRRQDVPVTYDMNASIYIWKKDILFSSKSLFNKKTFVYEMPYERSIDIDSNCDFNLVKLIMQNEKLFK